MEEKSDIILKYKNDYQLSFLHNILNRSISGQLQKNEIIPPHHPSSKPASFRIFPVNLIQIIELEKFHSMFFRPKIVQRKSRNVKILRNR